MNRCVAYRLITYGRYTPLRYCDLKRKKNPDCSNCDSQILLEDLLKLIKENNEKLLTNA